MTQLSICIPTYNRAHYLRTALESIFEQPAAQSEQVEVVVCDNASTDNTEQVAQEFKKYKNFSYFRNPQNIEFDGNFLKVISLARGRYCVVLGDDDTMLEGALEYLLQNIKSEHDFYLNSFNLSYDKTNFVEHFSYLKDTQDGQEFDMGNRAGILDYLHRVKFNAGLFGYIGGFTVKRELLQKVPFNKDIMGLGWVHIYTMWYLKNFGCKFKFLARPIINMRMQNDEIIKRKGWVHRLLMEYKGLYIISSFIFDDDLELQREFLSVVKKYLPAYSVPPLLAVCKQDDEAFEELAFYISKYPYSENFKYSVCCPFRLNPLYFVRAFLHKPFMLGLKRYLRDFRDKC